ncbi:MAG: nicotinate-nucleotide adenylyltransferase [Acidobacteriota bacterium]|nr:nicotinate-nucleotide adenylyltransferase [Acidobacteriota bacterium]
MARRIAAYGGTFDPVHNGHMALARSLVALFALDEVLFIPAHAAPHKRNVPPTPAWHRYAMLALATEDDVRLRVSTVELDAPERPYTVETIERLQAELGSSDAGARLFFVMGADSWAEITTWRDWERLLSLCDQIVATRPGYELSFDDVPANIRARIRDLRGAAHERAARAVTEGGAPKIFLTDAVNEDISATNVRRDVARARAGAPLKLPVPRAVAAYIEKYGLYEDQA